MTSSGELSAVVLAGGRSRRMGREKATLEIAGVPLWHRQRDLLRAAGATEVFLSARDDQAWLPHAEGFSAVLFDALAVGGPIIGVAAGLERASHRHLAVLAIDLPRMKAKWFASLRATCDESVGAVGRHPGAGGFFEPLAAIYPKALMLTAAEALVCGDFSLQRFVAAAVAAGKMKVREIRADEAPLFENWNEPADVGPPPHA